MSDSSSLLILRSFLRLSRLFSMINCCLCSHVVIVIQNPKKKNIESNKNNKLFVVLEKINK